MINKIELVDFKNYRIYEKVILELMPKAKNNIKIASSNIKNFTIKILDEKIKFSDYLKYYARKNVSIQILTTPRSLKSNLFEEIKGYSNIAYKSCVRNHLKTIIVDGKIAYIGTANLTSSGIGIRNINIRNFEIGFIVSGEIMQRINQIFDEVWNKEYCEKCLYKKWKKIKCTTS